MIRRWLKGRVAHCPTCGCKTSQVRDEGGWWICRVCLEFVW